MDHLGRFVRLSKLRFFLLIILVFLHFAEKLHGQNASETVNFHTANTLTFTDITISAGLNSI